MPINCPKCDFENPSDTLYCGKCAAPLKSSEEIPDSVTRTLETPLETLKRGTTFAERYDLIEELGTGGMGKVYKAFDKKVEEEIALKILKPEIAADRRILRRFSSELKTARKIIHKNVGRMYDLSEAEGVHFITMEYVPGEDLKSFIKRSGQLTVGKALSIAKQICEGLSESHELGIVHRDLKPQNIMIDSEGNARIMDFGIARSLHAEGLTAEGTVIGTPEYMSPEQAEGEETDQRSDIYSLGVILFEMATGRLPFEGKTPLSIAMKHKSEAPPDPREINTHIPEDLSLLILRCMGKEKGKRIQSAQELLSGLVKIEHTIPALERMVAKKKIGLEVRTRRFQPYLVPAGIVLAAAVVMVIVGLLLFRGGGPAEGEPGAGMIPGTQWVNSIAVLPLKDFSPQKDQEAFCDGMTDALIGRLSRIEGLKVISLTSVMNYKSPDRNIKQIGEELNVRTVLEGSIQRENNTIRMNAQLINVADDSHLWSDSFDRKLESVFEVQDEISQSIAEALQVKLTSDERGGQKGEPKEYAPENLEAYEYYTKGMHFTKSKFVVTFQEQDFKAGVEMFEKAIALDPDYALAYLGLAWAYEHHYHVTGSRDDLEEAYRNSKKAYALAPGSAETIASRAYYFYEYDGDYEQAFQTVKKALEINPNIGVVNFMAGCCYLYHGLYYQALPYFLKSMELDPYYFWTPYKIATCYMNIGDSEKAASYFEKYFELAPVVLIFPGQYIALNIKMKRFDTVEELIARTEKSHPDYSLLPYCKALLLAAKGNKEEAIALYKNSEVYALLDMKDEAIEELNQEIRNKVRFPHIYYYLLLNNPFYDNLRDDPRFKRIVKREKKLYDAELKKYSNFK
ncbi:MAG: protein kinase [Candidatus Aminicenantes bacterium]|nr:protein kinase [Candidatus Aminicenantes bacterium]MDH5706091.1 protein kinase [Candidatus Aminicenantes bacterium]